MSMSATNKDAKANISVILAFLDSYSSGSWSEMSMLFEADARYEDSSGSSVHGDEQIAESFRGWKSAFPDAVASEVKTVISDGDLVAVELIWAGTHTVALTSDKTQLGSGQRIEPTGNRVTTPAVIIAELRHRRIHTMRHYYDMLDFLQQLEPSDGKVSA